MVGQRRVRKVHWGDRWHLHGHGHGVCRSEVRGIHGHLWGHVVGGGNDGVGMGRGVQGGLKASDVCRLELLELSVDRSRGSGGFGFLQRIHHSKGVLEDCVGYASSFSHKAMQSIGRRNECVHGAGGQVLGFNRFDQALQARSDKSSDSHTEERIAAVPFDVDLSGEGRACRLWIRGEDKQA